MFMERMLGYFADWLNSDSFTQWCEDVANFFDSLEPEALADDLEQIVRIIQNVAEWIWKTVKYVIDHKDEILDFIELLSEHLDTLAKGAVFGKLAIDIGRFTANLILLGGAIGKVFGAGAAAGEAGAGIGGLGATFSAMIGPASAVLAVIGALVADFLIFYNTVEEFRNSIDSTWSTVGETISSNFAKIKEALGPAVENVKKAGESLYDLALKLGIFDGLMATFDLVSNVIATVATSISGAITTIVQLISGDFTGAWETFKETISTGFDFLKNIFSDVATIIAAPFNTIKEIVLEFWDFIIGKFTDGKVSISDTIDGIKQNLVDKFNAIKTEVVDIVTELWRKVTELIRKIIESITGIKTAVGSISTTISGAMAGIKTSINSVATQMNQKFQTRIPHLAQGAVIPPNNEFLAVLGDQRRGTNIESPLSTMVDAFNMANKGGSEAELALLQEQNDLLRQLLNKEFGISESQIFRSVRNQNNMYKKSTGNSAFA